jgi:hypothetical protein
MSRHKTGERESKHRAQFRRGRSLDHYDSLWSQASDVRITGLRRNLWYLVEIILPQMQPHANQKNNIRSHHELACDVIKDCSRSRETDFCVGASRSS